MKCKTCNGTGIDRIQVTYEGDYEPIPCDCTVDPEQLEDSKQPLVIKKQERYEDSPEK